MSFPIALQLYTVREDLANDFEGTLRKVKAMGYEGVEFAGLFGHKPESIQKLTETVGFRYRWDAETEQYVHGAAAIILTPDGRVSRYIKSVVYDPSTLRLALTEAKEGKYRSTVEEVLLFCFHYDAQAGRYTLAATNIMRAGAAVTLLILGTFLAAAWIRGRSGPPPGATTDRK
jgi:protein SCO1/2